MAELGVLLAFLEARDYTAAVGFPTRGRKATVTLMEGSPPGLAQSRTGESTPNRRGAEFKSTVPLSGHLLFYWRDR
jgi:hypothetical protein